MAKRRPALRRKQKNTGGVWLTAFVILLAAAACLWAGPPAPVEVFSIFVRETKPPSTTVEAVTLPAREWYIVDADGQAVSAKGKLLEAEIVRESYGPLASIRQLVTEEIALRITASQEQLGALRQSAEAIGNTFHSLERMAVLAKGEAERAAADAQAGLNSLCATLDTVLAGTENPVVRGLAGLAGSCREAMEDLAKDASTERVQKKHAALALQYAAYIDFISGDPGLK